MEAELTANPESDGYVHPTRLLRTIFGAIRQAQVRDFHHSDATRPKVDSNDFGRHWALKARRLEEMPKAEVSGRWNAPQRKVIPDLRYVILALDDAKALALNASAAFDERVARVIARIEAETGADVEEIVDQLKGLDVCAACAIEGQERYCVCWQGNKLGRRLARLVDRANAGRADDEAQPKE